MFNYAYKRVYEGVNYRLRTLGGGRWASSCRPTSIGLMLSYRCNARCVHCDIWKNRGKEDSPSLEQWKTLLTDVRRWLGPVHVFISGGEALLKPYAIDVAAHGSSLGLFVEFLTHGYWDDQSKIEKLALTRPWRVTISLDGVGETHNLIRGREKFFEKTSASIETLKRVRRENRLGFEIRLKTVIMRQNLDGAGDVARYATQEGMHVFYQPIEQNYNTTEDSKWFEHSNTWPDDAEKAVGTVRQLIELKRGGFHIGNSYAQLEAMIPYFRNPDSLRIATQSHSAHESKTLCSALTMLQIEADGDVTVCTAMRPVGNIKTADIREIWENRPRWWEGDCCLEDRCTVAEKALVALPVISSF
ncbi:MAG TPA: radical SAM protein [Blastocatellia bacterium]|jgi:MoaA/NifB/PqqE/SkfB family radical SAM enzyme